MTPPQLLFASILWTVVQMNAIEIQHRLERLQVVGRVLYVAAHPDDENTQLISYLTHGRSVRTAYLSITRGDGGQNLIGSEQSPLMGVIRTHELMAARRVDGAEQMFTRARDFGYSKSPDEALRLWGHEAVLADVVWAVRRFRPHVIITRFPESGSTHGHHLASARLAREAFAAAADPQRFPEQLDEVAVWQARRLLYNVPNRFMPQEARPDDLVIDIGGFDAASGLSYGEIAANSRSMHKSQGFGAARRFGPAPERFRHLAGEKADTDLLDGVDTSWRSVAGGAALASALEAARESFVAERPSAIAPHLARALEAAQSVKDAELAAWAKREIAELLVAASGLLIEARADAAAVVPVERLDVTLQVLNRSDVDARIKTLALGDEPIILDRALEHHAPLEHKATLAIPADAQPSIFPWLSDTPELGRYRGSGDPTEPLPSPALGADVTLEIAGATIAVRVPVRHHWVDPVEGERFRDVEVLPPITVTPAAGAVLLTCPADGQAYEAKLRVAVRARRPGKLRFAASEGFSAEPRELDVSGDREVEITLRGELDGAEGGTLTLEAEVDGRRWSLAERGIDHRHLPRVTVLLPATVELGRAVLSVPARPIGHIAGPGDEVAEGLRRAGFAVVDLDDDELAHGDLERFGALLVGIRAFNTREALRRHVARLHAYAERGGTVVIQYTTTPRGEPLDVELMPYKLELGRGRVTDETAAVELLEPEHPLLSTPHRIDASDFAGWVQERGLYFGAEWDEERVKPLLTMADPGEKSEKGALLVAQHGQGRVIYTGLSLFRQIPAGVPGAYRLLANLLWNEGDQARGDEPPPVLGSWNKLYFVVLMILLVLIGSFYLLSRRYS